MYIYGSGQPYKYTVVHGVYVWFWPTLITLHLCSWDSSAHKNAQLASHLQATLVVHAVRGSIDIAIAITLHLCSWGSSAHKNAQLAFHLQATLVVHAVRGPIDIAIAITLCDLYF